MISLAGNLPGPLAAARLAQSGATVVKIEPPHGDLLLRSSPEWYAQLVAGQTVVSLDLRDAKARAELDTELESADVLLTASRPASLTKLGISWEILHPKFPRLCYVAIVGERSPRGNSPGHDLTYQAQAGLLRPPEMPRIAAADVLGAERAAAAVFELLLARERGGESGFAEVSLSQAAQTFAASIAHGLTSDGGPLGGGSPFYNFYRARDGWIALAALEPQFRQRIMEAFEMTAEDAILLAEKFAAHDCAHWERWGRELDVPLAAMVETHA